MMDKKIADKFNDYFINVGSSFAKLIPYSNQSPLDYLSNKPTVVNLIIMMAFWIFGLAPFWTLLLVAGRTEFDFS